jgi:2-polyprenyl-3-methyl-5-hydroxy-6-metoxy-1,4-benzoquinol methylase
LESIIDYTSNQEARSALGKDSNFPQKAQFTAHSIRLDDGSLTKPDVGVSTGGNSTFLAAKRTLDLVYPRKREHLRLADLGCLESGYTVEFARLGFQSLGLDVRPLNIEGCRYAQSQVDLPNLDFALDDGWNLDRYEVFDVKFCCGLFYHLDQPRRFLDMLSKATCRVLILDTHFSEAKDFPSFIQPRKLHRFVAKFLPLRHNATTTHKLGYLTEREGLQGRWFSEFLSNRTFRDRANRRLASWDNRSSFWIQREYLICAIKEAGLDLVLEEFDGLAPNIAQAMTRGRYRINGRGTFIGIKTASAADREPRYLGGSPLRSTPLS